MRSSRRLSKKTAKIAERRELVNYAIQEGGLSERQACRVVSLNRFTYRYPARKTDDQEIVQELQRLAARTALAPPVPGLSDQTWSLDFMSDSLSTGRAIRTLNTAQRG